jgi:hypothetical protein
VRARVETARSISRQPNPRCEIPSGAKSSPCQKCCVCRGIAFPADHFLPKFPMRSTSLLRVPGRHSPPAFFASSDFTLKNQATSPKDQRTCGAVCRFFERSSYLYQRPACRG